MNVWLILLAAICCVTGIGAVACARRMIRRSNLRLEKMVQAAMEGSFQEERFDEDIHSATESLLARYLSSSQIRILRPWPGIYARSSGTSWAASCRTYPTRRGRP